MIHNLSDYFLVGPGAKKAVESGLVSAEWYHSQVPREVMKNLMRRSDGPALRDTAIWLGGLLVFALLAIALWGSWWAAAPLFCYGVLYGGASDSRWHECGHGTAFKTRWMNNLVYQIACFMIMREPEVWRWSHSRHHSDTLIVGRDPEIPAPRPPNLLKIASNIFMIAATWDAAKRIVRHASARFNAEELTYIPEGQMTRTIRIARIYLALHILPWALAAVTGSLLPPLLMGVLPTMYGGWFTLYVGLTQHIGLAMDVLDHRLNSRTVYVNPITGFLYWNMNYHTEHHMFPMVPYHALPSLHAAIKHDLPAPYPGMISAYRELLSTLWRQRSDPGFFVRRELPRSARPFRPEFHTETSLPEASI
jgi:fatty acid desaturase